MSGAGPGTLAVDVVNANWTAGEPGEDGAFALLIVTSDGERHVIEPSPQATAALLAISVSGAKLWWDPDGMTLIAGGVVGSWGD